MFTRHIILIASLLASSRTASASCMHGTSLMPRQVENGRVEVSDFSYTGGTTGPLNWAGIKPENFACASASVQSPINIDQNIEISQIQPQISIQNVEAAEFENLGTTVEVVVGGTTIIGNQEFTLQQFHFHTPSEHRIGEEYFPVEMHMVHEAADGSGALAVMAVMFELSVDGTTTDLLTNVIGNIDTIVEPGTVGETGPLVFDQLINHLQTTPLFTYTGSLTTPPCADGLQFFVTAMPLPINVATFRALKSVVKFNSRYTQNDLGQDNLILVAGGNQEVNTAICQAGVFNQVNATEEVEATATETAEETATETATETAEETATESAEETATESAEETATENAEETATETVSAEEAEVTQAEEQNQNENQNENQNQNHNGNGNGHGNGGSARLIEIQGGLSCRRGRHGFCRMRRGGGNRLSNY